MALLGWLVAHHVVTVLVAVLTAGLSAAVLGQRRPTGSAYAWLLVLLFVPYLGIPLYVVFGGRKFRRRARSKSPLPEGVVGVASAHAHRIPETTARTVAWLDDGVAAYETFLREIRGAERSIHIVTFVVADDPTGCTLLEALAERAAAGVEVRLLLDDFLRFHAPRRLLRKLEAAGGEVRRFMPLFHLPFRGRGNLRNHRKIALFDGARAIVGGMNLADDYMGPLPSPTRWRDLSAVVTGDAVGPLGAIFDADWDFSGPPSPAARASVARVALLAQHEESRTPPPAPAPLRVVPSGPDAPNDAIYDAFLTAIYRAETRYWVDSTLPKMVTSAMKCTSVPRFSVSPTMGIGEYVMPFSVTSSRFCTTPRLNSMKCFLPSRRTVRRSHSDKPFTHETPTPCRPPDTL